jgi:hypothetical protein
MQDSIALVAGEMRTTMVANATSPWLSARLLILFLLTR